MNVATPIACTIEQYLELERVSEGRSEYHDGVIYGMPGGSIEHAQIMCSVVTEVRIALRGTTCRTYVSDLKIWIPSARRFFYPDISVICGNPRFRDQRRDVAENPIVVVEILSPSTAEFDRTEKFRYYRAIPELRQYVLVSQTRPQVEVFSLKDGFWVYRDHASLDEALHLESISISIPMAAIYEGIEFPKPPGEPAAP